MKLIKQILILSLTLMILVGCKQDLTLEAGQYDQNNLPEVIEISYEVKDPELPGAFFVMIDDHPKARPQLNLEKADIVYEMICEWTYTRYMAGFYSIDPVMVGPVRSARYYFAQTVLPYDTLYIHVGGNMDAMAMIKELDIKDMCDITNASGYYIRDGERSPPHNAYIKTESLLKYAKKRDIELKPLPNLETGELTGGRDITSIDLIYGTVKYPHNIKWEYQAKTGRFLRYLNGEEFKTASYNSIYADNLIIIEAPTKLVKVPVDGMQSEMKIIGKGRAIFLRNGKIFFGTWQKDSAADHFTYRLDDGRMWVFKKGNAWVQQVHSLEENTIISFSISE